MSQAAAHSYHYQITLDGCLDDRWREWFSGFIMTTQDNVTLLTGEVADQAALRGVLNQIWDFNLTVIAVERLNR